MVYSSYSFQLLYTHGMYVYIYAMKFIPLLIDFWYLFDMLQQNLWLKHNQLKHEKQKNSNIGR